MVRALATVRHGPPVGATCNPVGSSRLEQGWAAGKAMGSAPVFFFFIFFFLFSISSYFKSQFWISNL
jgi:hypothetical protein